MLRSDQWPRMCIPLVWWLRKRCSQLRGADRSNSQYHRPYRWPGWVPTSVLRQRWHRTTLARSCRRVHRWSNRGTRSGQLPVVGTSKSGNETNRDWYRSQWRDSWAVRRSSMPHRLGYQLGWRRPTGCSPDCARPAWEWFPSKCRSCAGLDSDGFRLPSGERQRWWRSGGIRLKRQNLQEGKEYGMCEWVIYLDFGQAFDLWIWLYAFHSFADGPGLVDCTLVSHTLIVVLIISDGSYYFNDLIWSLVIVEGHLCALVLLSMTE